MEGQSQRAIERISTLLSLMGFQVRVEEGVIGDSTVFTIRTDDAALLIGEDGQNLLALTYIIRRILEHEKIIPEGQFLIDVNDYQRRRYEDLRDTARMGAQRVRYFKKEIILEPMSAFDRRIIHLTLQEYPDIATESIGQGDERKVIIKPFAL